MTDPRNGREQDFESRWSSAGAEGGELARLQDDLSVERARSRGAIRTVESGTPARSLVLRRRWYVLLDHLHVRTCHRERMRLGLRLFAFASVVGLCALGLSRSSLGPRADDDVLAERSPTLELPDGRAELSGDAVVRYDSAGVLHLDAGTLLVEIRPRPPEAPPLLFQAGDVSVEVVGTVFALHVREGVGAVRVYEGAVRARIGEDPVQRVDASTGLTPAGLTWEGPDRRRADVWGERARQRREAESSSPRAPAAIAPRSAAEPTASARQAAASGETRAVETAREDSPPARGAARPKTPEIPRPAARETRGPESAAAPKVPSKRSEAGRGVETEATPARGERPSDAALRARSAEIRLYRRGLELLQSGRPTRAAEIFQRYLASHPDGLLVEEARLSRLQALGAAGHRAHLELEAEAWLETHAEHPRADEVRELLRRARDDL